MAGSPNWKVYDRHGKYQAACKEPEAAAALMALYGTGATIRWGHNKVVWTEGSEAQEAAESWDHVAITTMERVQSLRDARYFQPSDPV